MTRFLEISQAMEEAWKGPSLGTSGVSQSADTIILEFWPPELWEDRLPLF